MYVCINTFTDRVSVPQMIHRLIIVECFMFFVDYNNCQCFVIRLHNKVYDWNNILQTKISILLWISSNQPIARITFAISTHLKSNINQLNDVLQIVIDVQCSLFPFPKQSLFGCYSQSKCYCNIMLYRSLWDYYYYSQGPVFNLLRLEGRYDADSPIMIKNLLTSTDSRDDN